jgi:putative glutamine amidotransferase
VYDIDCVRDHATIHESMTFAPFVIVTATTEVIRDRARVRVNEAYISALTGAGLLPLVLAPVDAALAVASLTDIAGLVLTGGEDVDPARFGQQPHAATGAPHRARDSYELALARAAFETRVPTLAICRGAQVMNVALGGTLIQDISSQAPSAIEHDLPARRLDRVHHVDVDKGSRLAEAMDATSVVTNSSHHQSVDRVASDLIVTARAKDGIVEAVESRDDAWWMVGVQWHPEELIGTTESWDRDLFAAFAAAVREVGYV